MLPSIGVTFVVCAAVVLLSLSTVDAFKRHQKIHFPDPVDETNGHGLHRQHDGATTTTHLHRRKGHLGHDPISHAEYFERKEKAKEKKDREDKAAVQPGTYHYHTAKDEENKVKEPVVPKDHVHKPWPNLKGTTREQREQLRGDLHSTADGAVDEAGVFTKHGFENPGQHMDPGKCYSAAGKYCKGLTYDHASFLRCAIDHRDKYIGDDEHCQWEIADLWAPCGDDLVRLCPSLDAGETVQCIMSAESSEISSECDASDLMSVLRRTVHEHTANDESDSHPPRAHDVEDL